MDNNERDNVTLLFDFYGNLLTDKQKDYIQMYYMDDFSMVEIAEELEISRSAVSDNLKKAIANLEFYESNLKLIEKSKKRKQIVEKLRNKFSEKLLDELLEIE